MFINYWLNHVYKWLLIDVYELLTESCLHITLDWCLLTIDVYKLKVAFVNIDWHYYWIVILIWFLRSVFLRAEIYFLSLTPGVSYVPWTYNSYRRSAFFTWSTDEPGYRSWISLRKIYEKLRIAATLKVERNLENLDFG